jgi:tetratricopeptide (TPR) repeat protein
LAVLYFEQGRTAEAEAHWRAALAEQPAFEPAWLGLGELYLAQGRWQELEQAIGRLNGSPETVLLRARAHLRRQEFAAAKSLLNESLDHAPNAVAPRVLLSQVLLQEGRDWAAAEQVLREVLAIEPRQTEARRNLEILLAQRARA